MAKEPCMCGAEDCPRCYPGCNVKPPRDEPDDDDDVLTGEEADNVADRYFASRFEPKE